MAFASDPATADVTRQFVDDAKREVEVPTKIERVYAAGAPAAILLYTLAPERLIGWNRALTEDEKAFMPPAYRELPELGRLTGRGDTANVESVLKTRPHVILDYGATTPTFVSLADRVARQTGVPYVLIDGSFRRIPQSYRQLGRLLGAQARAEELAAYAERVLTDVEAIVARIPSARRPRVYYGRRPDGLETGRSGSINVELLDVVGAVNVAAAETRGGLANVSPEQVLQWNPDAILTLEASFYESVFTHPLWRALPAVRDRRVFLAPSLPFGWFDRPPSVNRLIGVKWLLSVLYPAQARFDLRRETRAFYRLFYHIELDEAQLERLLARATARAR